MTLSVREPEKVGRKTFEVTRKEGGKTVCWVDGKRVSATDFIAIKSVEIRLANKGEK